jgi:transcriptional repressor NrdR
MRCIFCGSDTKVTDKRESGEGTRRRRECLKCEKRFTTYEIAEKKDIIVVKKDGRREAFSKEKIKAGIMKACEKRPVSIEKIDTIINNIEEKLRSKGKEIKTEFIGKMVMNGLKKIDNIAYVRFASVYMNFQDIKDFKDVVKEVKSE